MGIEQSITIHFFKALATAFDPHTEFFSKAEMVDFQTSISSKTLSWGFDFAENKIGQSTINRILPGGPAWNSNVIHQGDVVTELNFENGLVLDPLDYSSNELNNELKNPDRLRIKITLQRLDGKSEAVRLEKSEADSEENSVQGFVLKGEKKIGYIHLPAFYTNWDDPSSKGCANDVAKELVKLKKENISGIILDLRFNGGGLVKEAVELAGVFIDFGPLMIFKEKEQALVLKDINRGVAYDGPLLILINGLSASASEIVAATLQDHHRAIIAGAPSFGKSTGQAVFPVVRKDTLGFVKVTQEKIYRVTGKSHQRLGVVPDIALPDLIDFFGYSEKNYTTALPNDSIIKKVYYYPLPAIPLKELSEKSVRRIESSPSFQRIRVARDNFTLNIPLELNDFLVYLSRNETVEETTNTHGNKYFDVITTQFDNPMLQLDSYTKEISNHLREEIAESPYVEESFKILLDYVQFKSKQK
jgi:carboxyl-terminal processing protease